MTAPRSMYKERPDYRVGLLPRTKPDVIRHDTYTGPATAGLEAAGQGAIPAGEGAWPGRGPGRGSLVDAAGQNLPAAISASLTLVTP
jgi:hypothetical protein